MPITLQSFALGDSNYIGKHNANVAALLSFLGSVESALSSVSGGAGGLANSSNIGSATYGGSGMVFVGSGAFADSTSGTNLTLTGGYCWDGDMGLMHATDTSTVIPFVGLAAATYYIRFNGADVPYADTITSGAIYSVVWNGTTFGTITQLATITPTAPDISAMNVSTYSGITYATPAERLVATEKAFSAMLAANMASGNFTPTTAQAMEAIGIRLTGALTANRTVTVPNKSKAYLCINECTGAFTVTVKTAAGTGIDLLSGETAILYCDATNVVHIFRQGANVPINSLLKLNDTPDAYTGQGLRLLRVRADETGTEFVAAGSALSSILAVKDEGTAVDSAVVGIDFEGSGVAVTQTSAGQVKVTVTGGGALAVKDDGTSVDADVLVINFAGDGVTVTQTAAGQILVTIPGATGGAVDYDVSTYIADKRPGGAVAFRHTFTKAVDFAANFALSESDAVVAATASAVFLIKKNGTQVGTLTFAASGATGTFATTGGATVSFVAGDILEITAPSPQDAALLGVSITLAGVRA